MSDTKKNYKQHESWANISLLFAAVLFFVTLYAAAKNPGNIFLEGLHFAVDAALVGAIADWFAVTAIFNHPFGIPIPNTAILPKQKAAFAEGSAKLITEFMLTQKTVLRKVKSSTPLLLQKVSDFLKSEESQRKCIAKLLELVGGEINEAVKNGKEKDLAEFLRQKSDEYDTGKLLNFGVRWIKDDTNGRKALNFVSPYLRNYVSGNEFFEMLKDEFQNKMDEQKGILAKVGMFVAETFDVANPEDAAKTTQQQFIKIAEELGRTNSDLQNTILELLQERAEKMANDPFFRDLAGKLRREFIRDLPLEDVIKDLSGYLSKNFQSEQIQRKISDHAVTALRSHVSKVLKGQFQLVAYELRNDSELKNSFRLFLQEIVGRTALVAREHGKNLVQSVLKNMTDEQMNEIVKAQISKDLMFIRFNGAVVGGIIGTILFLGLHVFQNLI